MKRLLTRFFPHAVIVLSLMTLTFFGLDRFNPIMAFMTSELSKWVFALLAVTGLITAILLIGMQWSEDDRKARRTLKQRMNAAKTELDKPNEDESKDA